MQTAPWCLRSDGCPLILISLASVDEHLSDNDIVQGTARKFFACPPTSMQSLSTVPSPFAPDGNAFPQGALEGVAFVEICRVAT